MCSEANKTKPFNVSRCTWNIDEIKRNIFKYRIDNNLQYSFLGLLKTIYLVIKYHFFIADLIAIGDIESFFNENFFKKVPAQERKIDHRHNAEEIKFNGVPESQYEPYYNTYIPYNSTRPRVEKTPISSKPVFTKKYGLSSELLDPEMKSFTSETTATQRAFMKNNILDQHDNKV